jgi:hypothetical protein
MPTAARGATTRRRCSAERSNAGHLLQPCAGFDERAVLCDNPLAVLVRLVLLSILLVACDAPSDLPHLQDTARAMVKDFENRFDDLARRVELIRHRGSALPAEVLSTGNAGRVFRHAVTVLEEYRRLLQRVPSDIQGAAQGGARKVMHAIDTNRENLRRGAAEVTAELGAVEAAIAISERDGPPPVAPERGEAPIR